MPESATECTPSASIDADPVIAAATNLATAMPRFAPSAVITARALPSAAMNVHLFLSRPETGRAGSVILGGFVAVLEGLQPGLAAGGDDGRRALLGGPQGGGAADAARCAHHRDDLLGD